jgi:hypothetical protein
MKAIYLRAEEKKGKYKAVYYGIQLENNKEEVSLLAVCHRDEDDIDIFDLLKSEYEFKPCEKEAVEHRFKVAVLKQESEFNEATVRLMQTKRNMEFCKRKVLEYFK